MESTALKRTKILLIQHLKSFLNNPNNYEKLIPNEIPVEYITNARVYNNEPYILTEFPMIVISSGTGEFINAGLGDFANEVYNQRNELVGYRYGGIHQFNVNLEIGTKTTFERETMVDLITKTLRVFLKRKLEQEGIQILGVRYNGESTVRDGADNIYVTTIGISTWSEWYEVIELQPVEYVDINLR